MNEPKRHAVAQESAMAAASFPHRWWLKAFLTQAGFVFFTH